MPWDYGYIRRTEGRDGDHVDIFLGPDLASELVFVVDQVTTAGRFDEHKCLIGFSNREEAEAGYLAAFEPGWKGLGATTAMTLSAFKTWLKKGDTKQRVAGQVSKYGRNHVADTDKMVEQFARAYYQASSEGRVDAFWADQTTDGSIVTLEKGQPLRYTRSRGQMSVEQFARGGQGQ